MILCTTSPLALVPLPLASSSKRENRASTFWWSCFRRVSAFMRVVLPSAVQRQPGLVDQPCRVEVGFVRAVAAVALELHDRGQALHRGVAEERGQARRADVALAQVGVAVALRAEGDL